MGLIIPLLEGGPGCLFCYVADPGYGSADGGCRGCRARLTYSAGTFLCNHIMYSVLHLVAEDDLPAGFIHVPPTPELISELERSQPSMALETIRTGVIAGVTAVVENI